MFAMTPFQKTHLPARNRSLRSFDDLFDRLFWVPVFPESKPIGNFDLYEKDGKVFLAIDAPGAESDDFEIVTTKDKIAIKCKKTTEEGEPENEKTWYSKKSTYSLNYEISLPVEIDTEHAEAVFENGVIHISAPKLELSESKVLPLKKA